MRMPWEEDKDWGNTATTIIKGEPMIDNYVIAELLKKYEALEKRLSVAEKQIKVLEMTVR